MDKKTSILFSDSNIIDEVTLKKALIASDKIILVDLNKHNCLVPPDSIEENFTYPNGRSVTIKYEANYGPLIVLKGEIAEFNKFIDTLSFAINKNVIDIIDPNPILKKKGVLLRLTYDYDLANDALMAVASRGIKDIIYSGNKILNLEENRNFAIGLAMAPSGHKSIFSLAPKPTTKPFDHIENEDERNSIKTLAWSRMTKVMTILALSNEYSAIPTTDNVILNEIILQKYKWLCEIRSDEIRNRLAINKSPSAFHYQLLARAIVEDIFSDEEIKNIPIRKILAYKKACEKEYIKFKSKLDKITNLIESELWNKELENEIQNIILKDITPNIEKYIDTKLEIKDRIIGSFIKGTPNAAINTLKYLIPFEAAKHIIQSSTSFIIPEFLPNEILLFSGLFGANIIKESIKDLVDTYIASRSNKRNSLIYLLRLKNS